MIIIILNHAIEKIMSKKLTIATYPHMIVSEYSKLFCDFADYKNGNDSHEIKIIPTNQFNANDTDVLYSINNITDIIGAHVRAFSHTGILNLNITGIGLMPENTYMIVKKNLTEEYLKQTFPVLRIFKIHIDITYHMISIIAYSKPISILSNGL
jgi:hypothetical protein